MTKPVNVVSHEHYFPTEDYLQSDDSEDDISGRYDAYETSGGETGVWSCETDQTWVTKSFVESRRLAKALCDEYRYLAGRKWVELKSK